MPFFKNLKKEICQVLEPEIEKVVKAGWKELTVKEEEAYRLVLTEEPKLTSAVEIEAARVKAGIYDVLNGDVLKGAKKAVASKVATSAKKPVQTAANKASKGTTTNATK